MGPYSSGDKSIKISYFDEEMIFKKKIKNWTPKSCHSRLCKIYIDQVGFMN